MTELFGPCPKCRKTFKSLRGLVHHRCRGRPSKSRPNLVFHETTLENLLSLDLPAST